MASHKLRFEQLDEHSRDYLMQVRARSGRGMPGVFVNVANALPAVGCFCGLLVLVVMGVLSWNQIEHEPLGVAMLETAGLLLGGWLIIYAFRVWGAGRSSKYIGTFVYADAGTLWECSGADVTITDLNQIAEAKGAQNYSSEGKYTHMAVSLRTADGSRHFNVHAEESARQLVVFLNMLAWMRTNSDANEDGIDYKKLPPAIMGGLAREIAERGDVPRDISAQALGLEINEVPEPRQEGRASSGVLAYLLIIAVAVGGVFLFKELNVAWRDDAIWKGINDINPSEERPRWLRMYLADSRNVKHRDEAKQMLRDIYRDAVTNLRNDPNVERPLGDGIAAILTEIADQPQGAVSVRVKESGGPNDGGQRQTDVRKKYTLALMKGLGPDLMDLIEAPDDVQGMIEIEYKLSKLQEGAMPAWQATFTLSFRKTHDGAVVSTYTRTTNASTDLKNLLDQAADDLGTKTAGQPRHNVRLPDDPPSDDF